MERGKAGIDIHVSEDSRDAGELTTGNTSEPAEALFFGFAQHPNSRRPRDVVVGVQRRPLVLRWCVRPPPVCIHVMRLEHVHRLSPQEA